MTITSDVTAIQIPGNGSATIFAAPMKIFAATDIRVGFIVGGAYTAQTSGYQVSNIDVNGGCTITFTVAPPLGTTVDLRTQTPQTQGTEFANLGAYLPESTTDTCDRITRILQDLSRLTYDYGIHGPDTDIVPWAALPPASQRLGMQLICDPVTGNPTVGVPNSQVITTSLLAPFLNLQQTPEEIAAGVTPINLGYALYSVFRYGAMGDGVTDDTIALTNAHKLSRVDYPGPGGTFLITAAIPISIDGQVVNGNGSKIVQASTFVAPGGSAIAMNVAANTTDIWIYGLNFDGSAYAGGSLNNQFLNFVGGCDRAHVINCHFANQTDAASNLTGAVAFLQPNKNSYIVGCSAENMAGLIFSQGEKTLIANCWTRNCVDVSFVLHSQASIGSSILGCKVLNEAGANVAAHIQCEEGPSDWIIADNYIKGVRGGLGIGCFSNAVVTVVRGGIIANNIIDGASLTTSTGGGSSLIGVSNFYGGVRIEGNILMGTPHGVSGCAAIVAPSLQTRIINNRIDASSGSGNTSAIVINIASDYCDIIDNWINNTGNSRCVTLGAGNQGGGRIYFRGGSFIGGQIGIDTALNAPTNCPIYIENILESTVTLNLYNPSVADSISGYFQAGNAWRWPHSIKQQRSIYGAAIPTQGAWSQGDVVFNIGPTASGVYAWVCVTAGTPGTWKTVATGA